jgi:sulfopyruvate decarboxylase subunit alpha
MPNNLSRSDPGKVVEELKRCGITHVVGLPDNSSAALFAKLARDDSIRLVSVTREGEAFAIASGLWIGGMHPAVLIQNTGFLESGDGFRGTALRMRIPLLCLITYRGHAALSRRPTLRAPCDWDPDDLSRAEIDSAALVTEATLKSWGLPFDLLRSDKDIPKISRAVRQAERQLRPVALLITSEMI